MLMSFTNEYKSLAKKLKWDQKRNYISEDARKSEQFINYAHLNSCSLAILTLTIQKQVK